MIHFDKNERFEINFGSLNLKSILYASRKIIFYDLNGKASKA